MIREMRPADAARAAAIESRIICPPWSEADYLDALGKPTYLILAAADEDDLVTGYCVASMAADEAEIVDVGVEPEKQGCGTGNALVAAMLDCLRDRGIREVFLEVREHNLAAIRVYSGNGFAEAGRRKGFYHDPDEDAIIMKKEELGC